MISNLTTNEADISHADTAWVLVASCFIFLMVWVLINWKKVIELPSFIANYYLKIPGVGYYYGGIIHKKNMLSVLITTSLAIAVVSIEVLWFLTFNKYLSICYTEYF